MRERQDEGVLTNWKGVNREGSKKFQITESGEHSKTCGVRMLEKFLPEHSETMVLGSDARLRLMLLRIPN